MLVMKLMAHTQIPEFILVTYERHKSNLSLVAKLRSHLKCFYLFFFFFFLYIFFCHGSLWQPQNRIVRSCEIWHTLWGQSPHQFHQVSCLHFKPSSATNGSNLKVCLHTLPLNHMPDFQKVGIVVFPGSRRVQRTL